MSILDGLVVLMLVGRLTCKLLLLLNEVGRVLLVHGR